MAELPDANPKALKHLFGEPLLKGMADAISKVYPRFNRAYFVGLFPELKGLEMKRRVWFLRDELRRQLPSDYARAIRILMDSAQGGNLTGFELWPYSEYVQTYGLDHLQVSLETLKELTPLFSSEFAVRPFLRQHPAQTLNFLKGCARDNNVHIRRWASEGSRPRLPWGERLHDFVRNPSPTLEILELLKFDDELYVRKSVSNHLNDIAKDHPERVIQVLRRWKKEAGEANEFKVEWIVKRALRTLIKNGHAGALKVIGVSTAAKLRLSGLKLNQRSFRIGDRMEFEFVLHSLSGKSQKIVVDYILHFVKANQTTSPKVFKFKTVVLPASAEVLFSKQHHLKKVTTRVYYPGLHLLEIQVNGKILGKTRWELSK